MSKAQPRMLILTFARRGEQEAVTKAVALAHELGRQPAAVGTDTSTPSLTAAGVEDIITYGEGSGARSVVRELRARRAEEAAVVYWGPGYGGHLKLELLALASGARSIHRIVLEEEGDRVGRGAVLRSVVWKIARAALAVAAGGLMCGIALLFLRVSQLTGGRHARRA
ncbi:MAG: hypothetical protein JXA57_18075 [Armatimonadetes bacterium]|nr:hypothetical protein [Armatimonadota bacterium]